MQDQYVGDVGDFGKYGLLRHLCDPQKSPALRLGVVWYLVSNEPGRADGKFINYLDPTSRNKRRFRECDPELWDALLQIVCEKKARTVAEIEASRILPARTRFFSLRRDEVSESEWLAGAIHAMRECEVVFLDPDNGLQVDSVRKNSGKAGKYVFFDHILSFLKQEPSLVIHHLPRLRTADAETAARLGQLRELRPDYRCFPLRYHRGTGRVFFVMESPNRRLADRVEHLEETPWLKRKHFSQPEGI